MASRAQVNFVMDKADAYRALQDARAYVTDFDLKGTSAKALYTRLERAIRIMRPWSTDGDASQRKQAMDYIIDIDSILSEKIGPASRREFPEQNGPHVDEYNVGDRVESGKRGTQEYDVGTVTSVQRARGGERSADKITVRWDRAKATYSDEPAALRKIKSTKAQLEREIAGVVTSGRK